MELSATNLHFHGLTIPALCHQDDVLKTSIQPGDAVRIPLSHSGRRAARPLLVSPAHPRIQHGASSGGASGALIVEGIERARPADGGIAGTGAGDSGPGPAESERPAGKPEPVVPKMLIDRDGDAANNGTGFGKPAKDLSINYVPVPYPDYPPAVISIRPGEHQLWRVLNASAITYLNLAVLFNETPTLGIVALDGVPLNANGNPDNAIEPRDHIGVPPGGRVEFIVEGPALGESGLLVTRTVDTGQGGENDPNRALAPLSPPRMRPNRSQFSRPHHRTSPRRTPHHRTPHHHTSHRRTRHHRMPPHRTPRPRTQQRKPGQARGLGLETFNRCAFASSTFPNIFAIRRIPIARPTSF